MSVVWFCIPTAAPIEQAERCLMAWRHMGYNTAIIAVGNERMNLPADYAMQHDEYPGWAASINRLAGSVLEKYPECQIIVTGGDDVYPDQSRRAEEIAIEFIQHFNGTLGVMQPSGDEWHHKGKEGQYLPDIAAWSPWLGREWCERAFMGNGPICDRFFHYYADVNLKNVAEWLGVFWQPPNVIHRNENWKRYQRHLGRPEYLRKPDEMKRFDKPLANKLKAQGYPGCGLL